MFYISLRKYNFLTSISEKQISKAELKIKKKESVPKRVAFKKVI